MPTCATNSSAEMVAACRLAVVASVRSSAWIRAPSSSNPDHVLALTSASSAGRAFMGAPSTRTGRWWGKILMPCGVRS